MVDSKPTSKTSWMPFPFSQALPSASLPGDQIPIPAGTQIPEVDSVLTSGEVQQLLEARGRKLSEIPAAVPDTIIPGIPDSPHLYGIPGGSGQHFVIEA